MLNRSASLAMSTSVLKALPGKLDIKRHSPSILYILNQLDSSKTWVPGCVAYCDLENDKVSFCDRSLSVVVVRPLTIDLYDISSP